MSEEYFYGTGRRKTSVARVRLYPGAGGNFIVNGKPLEEMLHRPVHRSAAVKPLVVTDNQGKFNVEVRVDGGGMTGWADAIAHGMARALCVADASWRPALKKQGLLTRDARMKERKKYGLKRARKAPQYTKR